MHRRVAISQSGRDGSWAAVHSNTTSVFYTSVLIATVF